MLYWLPTLLWMAFIFFMSSRPAIQTTSVEVVDFSLKKTAHFIEYFILTTLIFFSLRKTTHLSIAKTLILAVILSVIYAISDEFHQSLVPGRQPRVRDVLIDLGGAITACIAPKLIRFKKH